MIEKTRTSIITLNLVLLLIISAVSVQSGEETTLDIVVITEEDIDAYFNATAGGNVSIWIDGVEVKGEFISIWDFLNIINGDVSDLKDDLEYAKVITTRNSLNINKNNDKINNAFDNISSNYNRTLNNLFLIADNYDFILENFNRTVANNNSVFTLNRWAINMEGDYLKYKGESTEKISNLQAEIDGLYRNLGYILAAVVIIILVACGFFLFNKKYHFGEILRNGKNLRKNGKHHGIIDFAHKSQRSKKAKSYSLSYKLRHIRKDPQKSIVKLFF